MKRRTEAGLPVIAIVDAFVGALSIALILSLWSSPRQDWENSSPQAEVEISCRHEKHQDRFWFKDSPENVFASDELINKVAAAAPSRNLTLRIRLMVSYKNSVCADTAYKELTEENSVIQNYNEPPIFVLDIVQIEEKL